MNCHLPTIDAYGWMLGEFERMQKSLIGGELSVLQIAELLRAQLHPDRRPWGLFAGRVRPATRPASRSGLSLNLPLDLIQRKTRQGYE
jgi:hypothetical protein